MVVVVEGVVEVVGVVVVVVEGVCREHSSMPIQEILGYTVFHLDRHTLSAKST